MAEAATRRHRPLREDGLLLRQVSSGRQQSAALARHLWPSMEGTQTWEYIYLVDDVRAIEISYSEFNRATGSDPDRVPLGFIILNPEQAAAATTAFELQKF